jgi:hypothetical protein
MLAALPQPLEIQEVGGNGFLEGIAGPALIAVAAIIAAFVAAWVARRNHEEQLGNDRSLRDLDHARQSINSAVETVAEAVDACSGFAVAAWAASEACERAEEAQSETDARWTTSTATTTGSLSKLVTRPKSKQRCRRCSARRMT